MIEFKDMTDALGRTVAILGGHKKIGARLRPDLAPEAAGRWLADCLNPNRRERLEPDHLVALLRLAREAGQHDAMAFLAARAGYDAPRPVTPGEQLAELQRKFIHAVEMQEQLIVRMERLAGRSGRSGR